MRLFPTSIGVIHFVGIGGIGMSGIAEILNNLGYSVQGSDIKQSTLTKRLERLGIRVFYGHCSENVHNSSVVVHSSCIKDDNEELQEARKLGIPVIKRAEMLGELMKLKRSIAVAGTHGKTTTTSLIAHLLDTANMSPTVINGGIINAYGSNARLGSGDWIVVEADESDGSFNKLTPTIAVVTNIDMDHTDNFSNFDDLRNGFAEFIEKIPFYGAAVLCADHPVTRGLMQQITDKRVISYGMSDCAEIRCKNLCLSDGFATFDVEFSDSIIRRHGICNVSEWRNFKLQMVGEHNVQNSLAVVAIAVELKLDADAVRRCFASFSGVNRRFTKIGSINGAAIIDDYGHHPVEIRAVFEAARTVSSGKIFAVVQPHRYTRLNSFLNEFAAALLLADSVYVMPVYSAGEPEIDGVNHRRLVSVAQKIGHQSIFALDDFSSVKQILEKYVTEKDIVLFLGAGDISSIARSLFERSESVVLQK